MGSIISPAGTFNSLFFYNIIVLKTYFSNGIILAVIDEYFSGSINRRSTIPICCLHTGLSKGRLKDYLALCRQNVRSL